MSRLWARLRAAVRAYVASVRRPLTDDEVDDFRAW